MANEHIEQCRAVADRITDYLVSGGFFNPEMMEHEKVCDLLIDCRKALQAVAGTPAAPDNRQLGLDL